MHRQLRVPALLLLVATIAGTTKVSSGADKSADAVGSPKTPICFPRACVRKGMSEREALHKLSGSYELVRLEESQALEPEASSRETSYLVNDSQNFGGTVGVVTFTDRQLVWASRAWGYADDGKALALAGAVYSLIAQMTKERGATASIKTEHSLQRDLAVDQIKILFGTKDVVITILKRKEPNGDWATREVHVDETLAEEQSRN